MSELPPTVRPPTLERVREIADELHFDLTEEELEFFAERVRGILDAHSRLDEIPAPRTDLEYTDRNPGYRPDESEDPYNVFITKCRVEGADGRSLSGYDVGLKDVVCLAGVEMTSGSRALAGYVPQVDATIVTRMLDAGATITGKLNMESMSFSGSGEVSDYGPVYNPRDHDYLAGGSSSGPAAAVVAGEVDVAIGADQAGSIRRPAAWCGCVGFKPSYGLVPYTGILGHGPSYDHVGPMANSVYDCARVLDVIAVRADGLAWPGGVVLDFRKGGSLVGQRVVVLDPVVPAAVEQADVVVAVVLELPVGVGRKPVGVVAVEDDRRVLADAVAAHRLFEVLFREDVPAGLVLELRLPVEPDRAGRVALVVQFRVDVDFHEPVCGVVALEVVEVILHPVCRDENVVCVVAHSTPEPLVHRLFTPSTLGMFRPFTDTDGKIAGIYRDY